MIKREDIFKEAVDLCGNDKAIVVETGISMHESNGRSTFYWAKNPKVNKVISIDISQKAIADVKRLLHIGREKVHYIHGHSLSALSFLDANIDLLYLDSDLDPLLILHEALVALPKMNLPGIILIDDAHIKAEMVKAIFTGQSNNLAYTAYGSWSLKLEYEVYDRGYMWMILIKKFIGWDNRGYKE